MSTNQTGNVGAQSHFFGQWIGELRGSDSGFFPGIAAFCIEQDQSCKGFACFDQGSTIHGSRKDFAITIEGNQFHAESKGTTAFDFQSNKIISIEDSIQILAGHGQNIFYITDLNIYNGVIDNNSIYCDWLGHHNGKEISGKFEGKRIPLDASSKADEIMTWAQFKQFVHDCIAKENEFLFRGQKSNKHQLSTSFHREGRYDLLRYEKEACAALLQRINAVSDRQFDLSNPIDFGSFLSLAQHHGFPTPLLDWSFSPYIAAYFAFAEKATVNPGNFSRIFVFNSKKWRNDTTQVIHIGDTRLSISPFEFAVHNNPRHLPQQSVHTYTNLENPESWIRSIERRNHKKYLKIIDIDRSERKQVMKDLEYMGVTAASLFPGFEGICRSMKTRFFS
jgi:hypothetical protein